jgi:ubiquinone/menaquinone biosynthesis C-methylase UbiE
MWIWVVLLVAALLLFLLIVGFSRLAPPRQASAEGIDSPEAVQAYNRISRWPQFRVLRWMIIGEIGKHRPEGLLVDAGCGPGYLVAGMAKSFPHLRIIGVDIAEEMIQAATANLSSQGFSQRVEFRQGDVKELPFNDDSVDFVVSTLSLHHWLAPEQALQEIHRILKPGGQFLIFDLRRDAYRFFYWLLKFAMTFVVPSVLRHINEPLGSALSSYTIAESATLLSKTQFQQRKIKSGFGWMFLWGRKV